MRTITLHVSEQTADALGLFHTAHRRTLEKVTECRDDLRKLHPANCGLENCLVSRQLESYDLEIAVAESLQRLHHDLLESLQFAAVEAE